MSKQERFPLLLLLPLPSILLFLCPKDCLALSGPSEVRGIVGESLTVQCSYEENYKTTKKEWCKKRMMFFCSTITDTQKSKVSIKDDPENQIFTVTMENLTEADAGEYQCRIEQNLFDIKFPITISVSPASTLASNRYTTTSPTDIPVTDKIEIGEKKTSKKISDPMQPPRSGILDNPGMLLLILSLLIISLLGALFLAWRMMRKQKKTGEKSMVFLDSNQPNNEPFHLNPELQEGPNEPCYSNIELQERPSNQDSPIQSNPSVEYSPVITAQEQSVTYSILTFPMDNQNTALETQEYPEEKTEYSTIMKT
ncbi:CMRF35-like molecule 8 isoform X2 [Petaurus breviceps papuanus]|uniref:CMRF35-like molecule 8 isoform X2 n=1 Tax=Petaurus breviceps papuanus TaxID=3040969 RepID=UPI0036D98BA2